MNYSLGTIGAAQILEEPPGTYDEYKETDVALDPFYHDVPKLKHSKRRKRSPELRQPSSKQKKAQRKKRATEPRLKHSDIIKNDQDAVNVLKFLFDWYRNEKTNPARYTTPSSKPLVSDEIIQINDELRNAKPEVTELEISTGSSEEDPLDISFKTGGLFNKKSKYSILGDDKYTVTHEEVRKVNKVQQNLSFSDTKESPKHSYLDDYVDDNYEPETYKSKYNFEDHFDDHDRFKYSSSSEDTDFSEYKNPSDDRVHSGYEHYSEHEDSLDEDHHGGKVYQNEERKNSSIPNDYVDDNIEPLYYKDRYGESENNNKILEQRSSTEEKNANTSGPGNKIIEISTENHSDIKMSKEKTKQATDEREREISDQPKSQLEEKITLSKAHLDSIEIEDFIETSTKEANTIGNDITQTEVTTLIPSSTDIYHEEIEQDTRLNDELKENSPSTGIVETANQISSTESNVLESSSTDDVEEQTKFTITTTADQTTALDTMAISTTDVSRLLHNKDEEQHKTAGNIETNSVNEHQINHITESPKVNHSETEINVVVSKTTKTNKTRIRTNGRGRRRYDAPELSFRTILIEKLLEKPYRAKDDYNYLKTVSYVHPSTSKDDTDENNNTISASSQSYTVTESLVSPNDLLLPLSSTTEKTKLKKRRGKSRHKLEATSARSIRRKRPSPSHIPTDSRIHSSRIDISSESTTLNTDTSNNNIAFRHSDEIDSINTAHPDSNEPFSEILESTSSTLKPVIRERMFEAEFPPELVHTDSKFIEYSTELPYVDTTQTTPTITLMEKENLGTTNRPITEPTSEMKEHSSKHSSVISSSTSPDLFTQMDKIEEMYDATFVPTEKVHITKKKELRMNHFEERLTTSMRGTETTETSNEPTTETSNEPTTIWNPSTLHFIEKLNDNLATHSHHLTWTTTNLPTREKPAQTTLKSYSSSSFAESTTDETSSNFDQKTTEIPHEREITNKYSSSEETQAPNSLRVTEYLQKFIEEIETTTNSVVAPIEQDLSGRSKYLKEIDEKEQYITSTETVHSTQETTFADTGITTNEIKDDSYNNNQENHKSNEESGTETNKIPEYTTIDIHTESKTTFTPYDSIHTEAPMQEITTPNQDLTEAYTTIQPNQFTEPHAITQFTSEPVVIEQSSRRRPSDFQSDRHQYSTHEYRSHPITPKMVVTESHGKEMMELTEEPNHITQMTTEPILSLTNNMFVEKINTTNEIKNNSKKTDEEIKSKINKETETSENNFISESTTIEYPRVTEISNLHNESANKNEPELEAVSDEMIHTQAPTTQQITTLTIDLTEAYTTILPSPSTEPSTTQRKRTSSTKGPFFRRRPFNYQSHRNSYRHRFSTAEITRRPESRKATIEEEIINKIARKSKLLATKATLTVNKSKENPTDTPLRKSASPTQSDKTEESPLTTPLSRRTTVRKYFFFNCFNKETNKFYPDPRDCRLFHYCTQGYSKNQLLDMKFVCDFNTYFDDEHLICTKKKPKRCL